MKKLRLLVTKDCPKDCKGCCNKDWDLDSLPVVGDFGKYDEIIITGGEPLGNRSYRKTETLIEFLQVWYPQKRLIIYTASSWGLMRFLQGNDINGITLTLHDNYDLKWFDDINDILLEQVNNYPLAYEGRSLRLNIFKGVEISNDIDLKVWQVKKDIEWIPNCPLPDDEVFMKMPNI